MNCASFMNVLDLYAEGRLTPRRMLAAAAHAAACDKCRGLMAPIAAPPSNPAPQSLKAKLLAAAKAAPPKTPPHEAALALWPREARGLALAAAALAVVALLIATVGRPSQSTGTAAFALEEP